jgi:hypothetical protein
LKILLPKYPTCVVTKGVDLETYLLSAKRMNVSTLFKLIPIGELVDLTSIFQNLMGDLELEEFLDWVLVVEEALEFNRMLDKR